MTIQIKRSNTASTPSSLEFGEMAYSDVSDTLFIGTSNGSVQQLAGIRTPGILVNNQALVANNVGGINEIITANIQLNYIEANGSGNTGVGGYILYSGGPSSNVYWGSTSAVTTNTAAQYNWSNIHIFTNTAIFNSIIDIGNSTVNSTINSTTFTGTANNATNLGGTAAASYQLNSTLGANIASCLPTYAGVVNGSSFNVGTGVVANSSNLAITGTYLISGTTTDISVRNGTFSGNLTISGTVTTLNTQQLVVNDNVVELGAGGAAVATDVVDTGIFTAANNNTVSSPYYSGFVRVASKSTNTTPWYWIFGSNTNPNTSLTIDTSSNTQTGSLQSYLYPYGTSGAFIANSTVVNITANSTVSSAIVANSITLTTSLLATYGGTGVNTYAVGDILYAGSANPTALSKLSVPGSAANGQVLLISNNTISWGIKNAIVPTSGAPSSNVGINGDVAIDSNTYIFYVKASNTWSNGQSLIGPTGTAGSGGASLPVSPAYTNLGGTGNRTSIITVTGSAGLLSSGAWNNLVDGSNTTNTTYSIGLTNSNANTATVTFDFGYGQPASNQGCGISKVITEFTWYQSSSATHGTWNIAGSNDGINWTVLNSSPFTLGGASGANVYTGFNTSLLGFRYYQLQGVSGTTSGSPYIEEVTFKIGWTNLDGQGTWTSGGIAGQQLTATGTGLGVQWSSTRPISRLPSSGLLAGWDFSETSGNTCYDVTGNYNISLAAGSLPNMFRTSKGLKSSNTNGFAAGYVQTPTITNFQTLALLYRVDRGESSGFIASIGSSSGAGVIGGSISNTYSYYVGGGWDVHPLSYRSNGSQAVELNRGGWILVFVDCNTQYTNPIGLGGRFNAATSYCSEFEVAFACVYNRALTSSDRTQIYNVARQIGSSRGIYLNWEDAPQRIDVVGMWGESLIQGRSPIANLSASDQLLIQFPATKITAASAAFQANTIIRPKTFEMGLNQQVGDAITNAATAFGPEFGLAYQNRLSGYSRSADLMIVKHGVGGTYLSPSGTVSTNGAITIGLPQCWNPTESSHGGLYVSYLQLIYDTEQGLRMLGLGPNFVGHVTEIGVNDSVDTNFVVSANSYQTALTTFDTQFNTDTGLQGNNAWAPLPKWVVLGAPYNSNFGQNNTALGWVQTAQAQFVTALGSRGTLVNTASYATLATGSSAGHWDASGSKSAGISAFNALALT